MRVWNIELWLEGGVRISGRWKGYEPNSSRVMEKNFGGATERSDRYVWHK